MLVLITSVIRIAFIILKLPVEPVTEVAAVILPKQFIAVRQLICPVKAAGIPIDNPPVTETKPKGPALTPVVASTRVVEVIKSAIKSPATDTSPEM
jgi:hypothetical protein